MVRVIDIHWYYDDPNKTLNKKWYSMFHLWTFYCRRYKQTNVISYKTIRYTLAFLKHFSQASMFLKSLCGAEQQCFASLLLLYVNSYSFFIRFKSVKYILKENFEKLQFYNIFSQIYWTRGLYSSGLQSDLFYIFKVFSFLTISYLSADSCDYGFS
jgi:hypothetical protein